MIIFWVSLALGGSGLENQAANIYILTLALTAKYSWGSCDLFNPQFLACVIGEKSCTMGLNED